MQLDDNMNNYAKLQWACRRGMLELDVLLGNFLKEAYEALSKKDKALFIELLQYTDPELFRWLLGSDVSKEAEIQRMVDMIRAHARTRIQTKNF